MTTAARKVLKDCYLAHELMEAETESNRLRIQWIGALALCRLIGDVLDKVDKKNLPHLKNRIEPQWQSIRHEPIFTDFIKGSRDRALHQYDIDLHEHSRVNIAIVLPDGSEHHDTLDECLFMPLVDGFGHGEDARDIFLEALNWWDEKLSEIEKQ